MTHRCRLCTANDRDALVEELAGKLWESRRDPEMDQPWSSVRPYWREVFMGFAASAVGMLERPDGVAPSSHPLDGGSSTGRAA